MKSKKQETRSALPTDRIGVGAYASSKKRFWQQRGVRDDDQPAFQPHQFDVALGHHRPLDDTLSPQAYSVIYGDKSLAAHVGRLLDGIHKALVVTDGNGDSSGTFDDSRTRP